jgi:membrane dipeptidase
MNRLGMVINVSHSSDQTIAQAVEVSAVPVVATHHGLRMVNNIPRNMPEDLMRKIAAKGGVIGFQIGNEFHNVNAFQWATQHAGKPFWDTSEIANRKGQLTIEEIDRKVAPQFPMVGLNLPDDIRFAPDDWIAVVEKAIAVVGEDHVALGSDFDGGPSPPRGIRDISDIPVLTDAMLRRGWSEQRIRKFLGLNMLRVFRQITERQ